MLSHTRLICPPLSPRIYSDSCPISQWGYLTMSASDVPFSFCLQSFQASESFPMSRLFIMRQSIGASPLASVLPMTIQGWFPLGLTDLISLQSQGFSRVFLVVDQLLSHVELFVTPGTAAHWFPCPSPSPEACSNSCPLSQWCHPAILSSVIPFSSCFQSFPASGSFPMSWLFTSGCQSIGTSSSASVLPMNIQSWFPLGLTGLISLQYKGLSRIFSSTIIQKHQPSF